MAAPTYVATGTASSGTGNLTPGLPGGWAENDIFLLFVGAADANTVNTPSGYAHVNLSPALHNSAATENTKQLAVFWKRATSSESGPTVTLSGSATSRSARISAFRGCTTSGNPWDATGKDTNDALGSSSASISGITTSETDTHVVVAIDSSGDTTTVAFSSWSNANLASFTERFDGAYNANFDSLGMASGTKATAGATGTTTVSISGTAYAHVAMTIALKSDPDASPSAGAAGAVTSVTNKGTPKVGANAQVIG
jgi:hypothetical protein